MPKIHTITLNPAIDRILYLPRFQPEITNRLSGSTDGIGGKGTHVSINLKELGMESHAFGIVHGATGSHIMNLLKNNGISVHFQHYSHDNSRTNYLLIEDSGKCTCLASRGVSLSEEDIQNFIDYLADFIQDGDFLVLSGDASNCPDAFIYSHIMDAFSDRHLKIFLDASGDSLKQAIHRKPYLIKPNLDELSSLCGMPLCSESEIQKAVLSLDSLNIPVIAVSLGKDGSLVKTESGLFRIYSPEVHVCNTIGCGDSFLSGLIFGIYNQMSWEDTFRTAASISAATAESPISVGYDHKRAAELARQVKIMKLA